MAIIRQKYEGQLDDLIKELRRLGLRVYSNVNNAIESLSIFRGRKEIIRKTNHWERQRN